MAATRAGMRVAAISRGMPCWLADTPGPGPSRDRSFVTPFYPTPD